MDRVFSRCFKVIMEPFYSYIGPGVGIFVFTIKRR